MTECLCAQISKEVSLYRFGKPYRSAAVILPLNEEKFEKDKLPYFAIDSSVELPRFTYSLAEEDKIFGLGQAIGPLNKRGKRYRLFCNQDIPHTPEKDSVNSSFSFFIVSGERHFGVFIDAPFEVTLDAGFAFHDQLSIEFSENNFDAYFIAGDSVASIVHSYIELTGQAIAPPLWAFGYQQSRWGYPSDAEVREVVKDFRTREIPCDAIGVDIDYMERYKVFTTDKEAFGDFEQLVHDMQAQGVQLVPIIDPGVKIEKDYSVYEEGLEKGYYCTNEAGEPFVAAVWPDLVHFPDFLRPEVRRWWGEKYHALTKLGIRGFWNDMNEPQIFFTPEGLEKAGELTKDLGKDFLGGRESHILREKFMQTFKTSNYFSDFYHTNSEGEQLKHSSVHNLYGFETLRAGAEGIQELHPNERYFLISRSGYAGMQRYGGMWTGDNSAWWEHMLLHMRMVQSMNLCGMPYVGADIGGHNGDSAPELVVRWMQLGVFTPLYRNHSHVLGRHKEPWAFDEKLTVILRDVVRLRYAFLSYSYSEFMKSTLAGEPFVRPLFLEYDTARAVEQEDQFFYGSSLMVAPVHMPNANGRFVHLPGSSWLCWSAECFEERDCFVLPSGDHWIDAKLAAIPLFIPENKLIVLTEPQENAARAINQKLYVLGLLTDTAEYTCYADDGKSFDYREGKSASIRISVKREGDRVQVSVEIDNPHKIALHLTEVQFELYDINGDKHSELVNV